MYEPDFTLNLLRKLAHPEYSYTGIYLADESEKDLTSGEELINVVYNYLHHKNIPELVHSYYEKPSDHITSLYMMQGFLTSIDGATPATCGHTNEYVTITYEWYNDRELLIHFQLEGSPDYIYKMHLTLLGTYIFFCMLKLFHTQSVKGTNKILIYTGDEVKLARQCIFHPGFRITVRYDNGKRRESDYRNKYKNLKNKDFQEEFGLTSSQIKNVFKVKNIDLLCEATYQTITPFFFERKKRDDYILQVNNTRPALFYPEYIGAYLLFLIRVKKQTPVICPYLFDLIKDNYYGFDTSLFKEYWNI